MNCKCDWGTRGLEGRGAFFWLRAGRVMLGFLFSLLILILMTSLTVVVSLLSNHLMLVADFVC